MLNVLALKEEGTSPPVEGILTQFAEVRGIRNTKDATSLPTANFDILLIDTAMPRIEAQDVIEALRSKRSTSGVILLLDFNESPSELRRRLDQLAKLGLRPRKKGTDLKKIMRLLAVSQESVARMLNVSSRTVHRWLQKGQAPRNPELQRLTHLIESLLETLNTEQAIQQYLNHPNPSLGGERPIAFVTRGGIERIEADLQAIREGVYL